jgi:predicted 3-demethylubiquinone-9 3-methyltransferase (glyoxalase superfamily)
MIRPIVPCLWFDNQAEEAARFYTGIFSNSSINLISRYPDAGQEIHGRQPGSVMTVEFELDGQRFTALNGGPHFMFNEAVSFQILCDTQEEIDYYWDRLTAGGAEQPCGWLKDRFGVSWQVVPAQMYEVMANPDPAGMNRLSEAMFKMKKLDVGTLMRAYQGAAV